jgi:uncharacterized membrane protein
LWHISGVLAAIARQASIVVLVIGIAIGAGCSSSPAASSCPNDYPTACPDAAPSFAADVSPLIHTHCTPCHAAGQQVPTLDSYQEIAAVAPRVSTQVFQCKMPPAPRTPLTSEERQTLLTWLICGAMNN